MNNFLESFVLQLISRVKERRVFNIWLNDKLSSYLFSRYNVTLHVLFFFNAIFSLKTFVQYSKMRLKKLDRTIKDHF